MIPILYEQDTTSFLTNGLGRLSDAISCTVTEERNGKYELEMQYPVTGVHYDDLKISRIIYATPADGSRNQPFRIYKIEKAINGRSKVCAEHITYQASFIPVAPFKASNSAQAISGLMSNTMATNPFTIITDVSVTAEYNQEKPESIRARLGGQDGSILDLYGGEFEWDHYIIRHKSSRGQDRGVTLRYGKNITDLTQENNITNVYTAICPYYKASEDEECLMLPEKYISAANASAFPFPRIQTVDLTSEFEDDETATVALLRQKAQEWIKKNDIGVPKVSIKVSFVALWQTEEYKDIAVLERVNLCDTVTVLFEKLGVSAKAKVIKTVYNVLLDRYDSIELGEAKSNLSTTIANQSKQIIEDSKGMMEKAAKHATELLRGGLGGYVVLKTNAKGKPEEILIMDTDNIETARSVWRFNKNGWGYSSTGYYGSYGLAATLDGGIVADYIVTGTLNALLVDVINLNASNIKSGTLTLTNNMKIKSDGNNGYVVIDSSSAMKGYYKNTLYNIIDMASESGQQQLTIDAKQRLNIRAKTLAVVDQSYGTGSGTAYVTQNGNYSVVSSVDKDMSGVIDGSGRCKELWVNPGEENKGVYCTLPVFLKVQYTTRKAVLGMMTTGATTRTNTI